MDAPLDMMSAVNLVFFGIALVVLVGFFPALDAIMQWRLGKRRKAENRLRSRHDRTYLKRQFFWRVFSTKRVPRLTDQRGR